MFSVNFAVIISKLIKEFFGLNNAVTDEKALILVSTYEEDKPYRTDFTVRQLIDNEDGLSEQALSVEETVIPIKKAEGRSVGFVHIKSMLNGEMLEELARFINIQFRYEILRSEIELEHTDNEKLIHILLSDITPEMSKSIKSLASKLNYDLNHPMAVILAAMEENRFSYFNMDMGYSVAIKSTRERIIKEIRNHINFNNRDIIGFTNEGSLVILKAFFSMEDLTSLYILLHKNVEQVDNILSKYKIFKYVISNGHIVDHYSKIRSSYKEAMRNIEIARMAGLSSSVVFPEDILFKKLIDNFSVELIEMEIMPLVKKITENGTEKSMELLELFEQLCACDFNISETASKCFLHRNTVASKLDRLKGITGLDPMGGFKERLLLKLLYSYIVINKPELK